MNYNARLEQREAKAIADENNEAARRQRLENERLKSLQRASYGKSGAAMASGSPLAVLGKQRIDGRSGRTRYTQNWRAPI